MPDITENSPIIYIKIAPERECVSSILSNNSLRLCVSLSLLLCINSFRLSPSPLFYYVLIVYAMPGGGGLTLSNYSLRLDTHTREKEVSYGKK